MRLPASSEVIERDKMDQDKKTFTYESFHPPLQFLR